MAKRRTNDLRPALVWAPSTLLVLGLLIKKQQNPIQGAVSERRRASGDQLGKAATDGDRALAPGRGAA